MTTNRTHIAVLSTFSKFTLAMIIVTIGMLASVMPSSASTTVIARNGGAVVQPVDRFKEAPTTTTTTTTTPPTTTTTVPAPPITTVPAPPTTTPPPPPPPTTAPPATTPPPLPSPALTDMQRAQLAYEQSVPAAWRGVIPVVLEIIPGNTSWGWPDGRIQIATTHLSSDSVLRTTIAHEFGHLIAFRWGAQTTHGAPPSGWPSFSGNPVESWADCVAQVFTGVNDPSHGLPSCPSATLTWTANWLAQGPGGHARTA